jgi:protein-S-isoprenylcysteine O-methyltransferase Ste14
MRRLLPPFLFVPLAGLSVVFGWLVPIAGPIDPPWRWLALVPLLGGLALNVGSAGLFSRIGTNVVTFNDPGTLVTVGPFRWTRNPMYLGFVLMLLGIAGVVGTASALLGPVVFFVAANFWYIPFEERRAHAVFGDPYDRYSSRVPRWIGVVRKARS